MKINNTTIAIAAATLVLVLGILAALIWAGRAPDQIIYLIIALIGPIVPGLANLAKTQQVEQRMQDVQNKVNGRMTQLIEKATANGQDVAPEVYDELPDVSPPPSAR